MGLRSKHKINYVRNFLLIKGGMCVGYMFTFDLEVDDIRIEVKKSKLENLTKRLKDFTFINNCKFNLFFPTNLGYSLFLRNVYSQGTETEPRTPRECLSDGRTYNPL